MGQPRIRDFLSFLSTLPASMLIGVCLFLPQSRGCDHQAQTPFESGTWILIVPMVLVGVLPVLWRAVPAIRRGTPELVLAFTLLVLGMSVITIPVAIWLMWGYAKRSFRGETLAAMCSVALVAILMIMFPLVHALDQWLPAAKTTWAAGLLELIGLMVWTSAAISRPRNADEPRSLHVERGRLVFELSV